MSTVRIFEVVIPGDKKIPFALNYVMGIGLYTARKILEGCNISPEKRAIDLSEDERNKIREYVESHDIKVESQLRESVSRDIKRLQNLSCYRGTRHKYHLPARGQKTKNNSRTRKGPRKSPIAAKKVK
jgi:small subunit ribosomal protein S13